MFDDGDERTLKRSSLCLKGGRHFHESESLDHLPLTDPENFGTPVMNSSCKKTGRKRRHTSQSPNREEPSKKSCRYPLEFPVGKVSCLWRMLCVRSCWGSVLYLLWSLVQVIQASYILDSVYHTSPIGSGLAGSIYAMYLLEP